MGLSRELGIALEDARRRTDELFALVRPEGIYDRTIAERHRIIFYLGHVEAFDWNLVSGHAVDLPSFHPSFDRLFAFGIDPPPGQLPCDTPDDWPAVAEVEQYSRTARETIDRVSGRIPEQILHVAIEHRLMHAETLAYILHSLAYEKKTAGPAPYSDVVSPSAPTAMVDFAAGKVQLGLPAGHGFGWDNEFQAHCADVPAFSMAKYKVTNGEYLDFVKQGSPAPFYWRQRGGDWFYHGMFAEVPLPLDCPVYITQREAQAYADWRGMRLPTEAEFHRAAIGAAVSSNADFRHWDPIPVTADGSGSGPQQLVGNGWEWTSSVFGPFPGFEPLPFYTNYSAPFFDGEHYILKGGSPRTAACMLRPSFRNWFRPAYPYVYATFRMVTS
jgi:gamma-glutamyl hercynylcysteine S-oxide synthase